MREAGRHDLMNAWQQVEPRRCLGDCRTAPPRAAVDEKPWSHRYSEENLKYKEECDYW